MEAVLSSTGSAERSAMVYLVLLLLVSEPTTEVGPPLLKVCCEDLGEYPTAEYAQILAQRLVGELVGQSSSSTVGY